VLNDDTYKDAFNLVCGHKVGVGMTRTVYDCNINPKLVIKVENADIRTHFQNFVEWMVWCRVAGTDYERWFAPVKQISPDGRLLVMEKTEGISRKHLPKQVPAFFTDLKPSNWGWLDGRVVCHDYGVHLLMEVGLTKRMRKAEWRDES